MRKIDELVRGSVYSIHYMPRSSCTFDSERIRYNELVMQIDALLEKKKAFDEMIVEDNPDKKASSFRNTLKLYNLVKNSNQNNTDLSECLLAQSSDLKEYINLCEELSETRRERDDILTESICFQNFGGDDQHNDLCYPRHAIIKDENGELVCAFCEATSKEYGLNEEEKEFLEHCASAQGMFLKEVTKNDIPLLRLLIEEEIQKKQYRDSSEYIKALEEELGMAASEELWLSDEAIVSNLRRKIVWAQMLDSGIYETDNYSVGNPKYLEHEDAEKLLDELDNKIDCLKHKTLPSEPGDLKLEICRTYRYEVLILAGNGIPQLYENAELEDEKIALVKAYFNLSNQNYRIHSGYFNPDHNVNDAVFYTCITAHPEINQKILEMKIKR